MPSVLWRASASNCRPPASSTAVQLPYPLLPFSISFFFTQPSSHSSSFSDCSKIPESSEDGEIQKRHMARFLTTYACTREGTTLVSSLGKRIDDGNFHLYFQVFGKNDMWFWVIFSAIHILASLALSTQIYYMGRFKIGESPVPLY